MTAGKNGRHLKRVVDPKRHEKARKELERQARIKSRLARYVNRD